jgi:small subunit ribosomal protein S20
MPQIKSAKKRVITDAKRGAANQAVRSSVKTAAKKVEAAVAAGDMDQAKAAFVAAESKLAHAAAKGVLKKETASRKVARLAKKVDKIGQ